MRPSKEPVRLREKTLKDGVKSLYLDIYQDGVRHYEYLKIYINPGTDPTTKARNRASMQAANMIMAQRLIDVQSGVANIMSSDKRRVRFIDYYNDYYDSRPGISSSYRKAAMYASYRWLSYAGDKVLLCKVTPDMLSGFARYLRETHNLYRCRKVKVGEGKYIPTKEAENLVWDLRCKQKMSYNQISKRTGIEVGTIGYILRRLISRGMERPLTDATVRSYFKFVTAVLNHANAKGMIAVNPVSALETGERPKGKSPERIFLTMDEVRRLADTECDYPVVKNMFLFSCFTGLRLSDVLALTWQKMDDNRIGTTMQKTKGAIYVPISDNARRWLPERGDARPSDNVFSGCPTKNTLGRSILRWCHAAGIDKHVTFHSARHTFATLALQYGADLYTISNLLGHQRITTTQVYAKIVDEKKVEAVNMIPDL